MKTAVILLNFGEPEEATLEAVTPFLERIFNLNRDLEQHANAEAAAERSRRLAAARAPGLVAEYLEIGGSPLHQQARDQAASLQSELQRRGLDAVVVLGMQFTDPSIEEAIAAARAAGATQIVGLPVYPLCGPTTTVAALAQLSDAAAGAQLAVREISGWHRHPEYIRFRARMISDAARTDGISLNDPRVHLAFSAHGTPIKYLNEGSRYEEYVRDCCARVAAELGTTNYTIGYQNHSNRPLEWTQPAVDDVIDSLDADHVVVDAISFMHEQSETLAELDHELREHAEARGLAFHRVPIAHDAPQFIGILADLVCNDVGGEKLKPCQCRPGAFCLNQ